MKSLTLSSVMACPCHAPTLPPFQNMGGGISTHTNRLLLLLAFLAPAALWAQQPPFTNQLGPANFLNGIDAGSRSAPALADLNGAVAGGDVLVSGNTAGTFKYYTKTINPGPVIVFTEQLAGANPLNGKDAGIYSTPAFVDIDGDGDQDLFSGESGGLFRYYRNTGSSAAPIFSTNPVAGLVGASNPLSAFDAGTNSAPAFVDIDDDGDYDCFSGAGDGTFKYYENTGTVNAPAFTERTGALNPLNGWDVGSNSRPTFVDLDFDLDYDCYAGSASNGVVFNENTGDPSAPIFSSTPDQTDNPFPSQLPIDGSAIQLAPVFYDVDEMGDLDAVIGLSNGRFLYMINESDVDPPTITGCANITVDIDDSPLDADGTLVLEQDPDLTPGTNTITIGVYTITVTSNSGCTTGPLVAFESNGEPIEAFDCSNLGVNTVLLTATDDCNGQTATCVFTLTIEDNIAPYATCVDQYLVELGDDGTGILSDDDAFSLDNGSYDNCSSEPPGGLTYDILEAVPDFTYTCADVTLTQTVTLVVTDASGNSSTCTVDISVIDSGDPLFGTEELADITVQSCTDLDGDESIETPAEELDGLLTDLGFPVAEDQCAGIIEGTYTISPDFTGDPGTYVLTWTYDDGEGNVVTQDQLLIVQSSAPPVFTGCNTTQTFDLPANQCSMAVNYIGPGLADCDLVEPVMMSHAIGSTFPKGNTVVTWIASDDDGNTAICAFNILVRDVTPPTLIGVPAPINLPLVSGCTQVATWSAVTATDDCSNPGPRPVVSSHASGSSFPVGTTVVTFSSTDLSGNTATATTTVTITDPNGPSFSACPVQPYTYTNTPNLCVGNAIVPVPPATDNCTNPLSYQYSVDGGGYNAVVTSPVFLPGLAVGNHSVQFVATDASGNSSSCAVTVIITDGQKPTLSGCPADLTINAGASCTGSTMWAPPTFTDNCDLTLTIFESHPPSTVFNEGETMVMYTATDDWNNTSTCSFKVRLYNTVPPSIACPADITVATNSNSCTATGVSLQQSFTDNTCGGSLTIAYHYWTTPANVWTPLPNNYAFPLGTTLLRVTATDYSGSTATCTYNVIVRDLTPPVVANCPPSPQPIQNAAGQCGSLYSWNQAAMGISDNCGVPTILRSHAPGSFFPVGSTIVSYIVTDAAGNTNFSCNFTVTVIDTEKPKITVPCPASPLVISVPPTPNDCTVEPTWTPPTFTDNCADITVSSSHFPGMSSMSPGNTTVTYTAVDAAGNSSSCAFVVQVVDNTVPPPDNCPTGVIEWINFTQNCNVTVLWDEPTAPAADNCCVQQPTLSRSHTPAGDPDFPNLPPNPNASLFPPGNTVVTYTSTDCKGNTATCTFTIRVIDQTTPTITCPPDFTVSADPETCEYVLSEDDLETQPTGQNACGGLTFTNDFDGEVVLCLNNLNTTHDGPCYGCHVVTWTATSGGGGSASCTQQICIGDDSGPVLVCPEDLTVYTTNQACQVEVDENLYFGLMYSVSVFDCSSLNEGSFDTDLPNNLEVGHTVVTFTAGDVYGNSGSCTLTITVIDNERPFILCPPNITVSPNMGCFAANVNLGYPNFNDNCQGVTISNSGIPVDGKFPAGTTLLTWIATDAGGNTAVCPQSVTVSGGASFSIICPPPVEIFLEAGNCDADDNIDLGEPTPTGGCSAGAPNFDNNAPGTFPLGTTTVLWTATVGNSVATCNQVVSISAAAEICGNQIDDNCNGQIDETGGGGWSQIIKKIAVDNPNQADLYGYGVAIDGDLAVVGARDDDPKGTNSGSVYILSRNQGGANNWGEVKRIFPADGAIGDWFGVSVAIDGNTIAVGASEDDDNAQSNSGSVYLFSKDQGGVNNWGQVKKLTAAADAGAGDKFGFSVGLSGDNLVVGAYFDDLPTVNAGSVYIFNRNQGGANNWGQVQKRTAGLGADIAADDQYGYSVAIDGNTIIVGARMDDDGAANAGSAYILGKDQGGVNNWGQVKKLTATGGAMNDNFGTSVGISGLNAIVGANLDDNVKGVNAGSAYIFSRDLGGANNWGQRDQLIGSDGAAADEFGYSVAIDGDNAVCGARFADAPASNQGVAYTFNRNQGGADAWDQVGKLIASDGLLDDNFGSAVDIDGTTAAIGAMNDDGSAGANQGSVYFFGNVPCGPNFQNAEERGADVVKSDVRCFPNPFTEVLNIQLSLSEETEVLIQVSDAAGRIVSEVFKGTATDGAQYQWDSSRAASGFYFIRVEGAGLRKVMPVSLVREPRP